MEKLCGRSSMGTEIPRITHQIWLQGWDELPEKFHENVRLLRTKNPDYRHMTWDEKSLRAECAKIGPEVAAKFDSFPHLVQKVDLGRFVVLYNYGGVSVDTDMKSLRSIGSTPHLDSADCMISGGAFPLNIVGHTNNALIITKPKNPFIEDMISTITEAKIDEKSFLTKELYINATTGPQAVQTVVEKHRENIVFLDNKFYEPCFSLDPVCRPQNETIMDHQHEMSWIAPPLRELFKILFPMIYVLMAAVPAAGLYLILRPKSRLRGSR
jgi:mannosyltransferase OCH1-like enzyme